MCDMQKMLTDNDSCSEVDDEDMNFAFTTGGAPGTHFVATSTGQLPVTKIQQGIANGTVAQMVGMVGEGMQYVRTLDGGAALAASPQLITLPIALPGAKPGDPQQMVQIQVLSPNMLQPQQQPKCQMQIPIQGFQQGGAVLTLAYNPENNDNGIQLLNSIPEGLQVVSLPQEMQLMQSSQNDNKDQMHQVFITQNQQILITNPEDTKMNNNNNNNDNSTLNVIVKEEFDENTNDDESSQGTDTLTETVPETVPGQQELVEYLNKLPPQQAQWLPVSLQQFLKLNPVAKTSPKVEIEVPADDKQPMIEITIQPITEDKKDMDCEDSAETPAKKKKKYKKKPPKPAKPKPGQVVITTATDGTQIYCCPECHMAYQEKEQLELHLSVHKIERRYICGICGAGLKRKEHLERHKLGHNPERPYVCAVCRKGFKRREHLNLHTVIHSGVKTEMCGECGKGFYRKDHLRKHARSHELRRAREESSADGDGAATLYAGKGDAAEITIHVPTSGNVQVPVQINIPQHVVSSLGAQQMAQLTSIQNSNQNTLDALLAQNT